jgi:hypothetical protein
MNMPLRSSLGFLLSALMAAQSAAAQATSVAPPSTTGQSSQGDSGNAEKPQAESNGTVGATGADSATVGLAPAETASKAEPADEESPDDQGHKKNRKKSDKDGKGDDADGAVLPWDVKPKIKVGGLIHTEFSINDAPADNQGFETPTYDFRLTNARVFLTWEQGSLLDAQAEIELSRDRDRNPGAWAPMRDAFVRVSPHRALRLRMGQFKRPFAGLQMISLRELKLIRRGVSDAWVNEELKYGERDVGFQVEGKIGRGVELHYALGVFNGTGRNRHDYDPNGAKDFVGRFEGHIGKHLTISYNFANKRFDQSYIDYASYPSSTWMSGADVLVNYAGLWGYVEGQYGTNYQVLTQNHSASALAMVAYKFRVSQLWEMALEPIVKAEVLRVETEIRDRRVLNGTAGVNYYIGDIFRLMVQGEIIDTKGPVPENLAEADTEKRLLVQAGMYTR